MSGKEIYKIWAPTDKKWTDWVRPVPFIGIDHPKEIKEFLDFTIPYNDSIKKQNDVAILIDLPGGDSIKRGIQLAKQGFRPIPIFNGTNPNMGTMSTTNNAIIEPFLIWGAIELKKIPLEKDAPPVFLLDSNRLCRYKENRFVFDNSWDVYPQDLPSAEYFLKNGITKIIVVGNDIAQDLKKILYRFQTKNLQILFTNGYENPKAIKIKKVKIDDL